MRAFDAIGQELFPNDVVACTEGGGRYGAGIDVGRVVAIFMGTGSHSKTVKVRLEFKGGQKKSVPAKSKTIKMEGFDFDAYLADL
jgi:hypothetical protein